MKNEDQSKQIAQHIYDHWEILTWESSLLNEGMSLLAINRNDRDDCIYAVGITVDEAFARFEEKLFFRKVECLNKLINLGNQ